jgi:hypothetical protein
MAGTGLRFFRKESVMTNKITLTAAEVLLGDHIYSGTGANAHPTFAWETITQIKHVDGLILIVAGRFGNANDEFWFEPDESVTVIRYPAPEPEKPVAKSHNKHGHGHST